MKRIEKTGRRETARRLRGVMSAVFRLAVVTLRTPSDPTYALQGALLRANTKPRAAITDEKQFGGLLRAIDGYDGWPTIKAALKFSALTFARPGGVRGATRSEINFDKAVWRIAAERTKMRRPHDVPLSRQALAVLADVWPMSEQCELAFPSIRSNQRPLSEDAFNSALRRMGYSQDEMTAHGLRSATAQQRPVDALRLFETGFRAHDRFINAIERRDRKEARFALALDIRSATAWLRKNYDFVDNAVKNVGVKGSVTHALR